MPDIETMKRDNNTTTAAPTTKSNNQIQQQAHPTHPPKPSTRADLRVVVENQETHLVREQAAAVADHDRRLLLVTSQHPDL